jgi:hypothetical protein
LWIYHYHGQIKAWVCDILKYRNTIVSATMVYNTDLSSVGMTTVHAVRVNIGQLFLDIIKFGLCECASIDICDDDIEFNALLDCLY